MQRHAHVRIGCAYLVRMARSRKFGASAVQIESLESIRLSKIVQKPRPKFQINTSSASVMLEWWENYSKTASAADDEHILWGKPTKNRAKSTRSAKVQPSVEPEVINSSSSSSSLPSSAQELPGQLEERTPEAPSIFELVKPFKVNHDTHRLKPSSSTGPRVSGYIDWNIRHKVTGQLLLSECLASEFVLEEKTLHLCREIHISGPDGEVRLKFTIPVHKLEIEGKLEDGDIVLPEYEVIMIYDLVRAKPEVEYWAGNELLAKVPGYRCPFSGRQLSSFVELLEYHAARHPKLLFSVHPLLDNAIDVRQIPVVVAK